MATNPMKRKARVSFILGALLMLLISTIVVVFLVMKLIDYDKKEKARKEAEVQVYALTEDVKSGQVITSAMYKKIKVDKSMVPSNATSDLTVIDNYALQDKEGNDVITKYEKNSSGKEEATLYLVKGKEQLKITSENGNYYIEKDGEQELVELKTIPLIAKVNMYANTIITKDLLAKGENDRADDVRKEEYNSFVLPTDLQTGDYIDVRLMTPSGKNYIVVSKKEVEIPNIDGVDTSDTVWLKMSESEILTVSNAIVDAYRIEGSKLYVNKYTEAGMQKEATPTYVVSQETQELIKRDPNILEKAKAELEKRYSENADIRKNYMNNEIKGDAASDEEELQQKVQTKVQESVQRTQENRKKYLDSLAGETVK